MVFSGVVFLYCFLPVTLLVYFIVPDIKGSPRLKNYVLLCASLIFYAWGEPKYVVLMAAQCVLAWMSGLLIEKYSGQKQAKIIMLACVVLSLSGLVYFKYANFFISGINRLTGADIWLVKSIMPIGISFYTFQIISYIIDIYRQQIHAQRNLPYFSAYVSSFPQLVAGPIVRYKDIAAELEKRCHSLNQFSEGARRFVMGLGKKVLLANVFAGLVEVYKSGTDTSVLFTWLYVAAFTLQIYFDFSGYSDMAIGLGKMLGFKFPENFNYPYIAGSITEFWKRWHITLSMWFRDYVYIPLGGSRSGALRGVFSLLFVWLITGFWHGADWNFLLWGGYFGIILLIEKHLPGCVMSKIPKPLRHLCTLLIIAAGWVLFDARGAGEAFARLGYMLGYGAEGIVSESALYYLRSYAVPLCIGITAATPLPRYAARRFASGGIPAVLLEPLATGVVLLLSTAAIVDGSYNPFIYFRF